MKKTGFTLAEILITLSIIGVIAAVTIPSLSLEIDKRQVGPALMKTVNTIENANSIMLRSSGVSTILQYAMENDIEKEKYLSIMLSEYTHITMLEYKTKFGIMKDFTGNNAYGTKDGVILKNTGFNKNGKGTTSVKTSGDYYNIYIDVNGAKMPNTEGKDIFNVLVDTKGIVIPYGSNLFSGYLNDDPWESWKTACPTKTKSNPHPVITDPKTCAGSIIENGGRILYDYDRIPDVKE